MDYVIDTTIYSHKGAKCPKCGKKIPYLGKAKCVKKGSRYKFYHPACYKKLKK